MDGANSPFLHLSISLDTEFFKWPFTIVNTRMATLNISHTSLYIMPSTKIRIEIPEKSTNKIEEQSQSEGISRQKIIQRIIEEHYSLTVSEPDHELDYLRRENKILYEHVELLRGVSAMIMAKQLLPAEEAKEVSKKPRWTTRAKLFLGFKRRE